MTVRPDCLPPPRPILFIALLIAVLTPLALAAQAGTAQGRLEMIWTEDPRPGHEFRFLLYGHDGVHREITLDRATIARIGLARIHAGSRVSVTFAPRTTSDPAVVAQPLHVRNLEILQASPLRSTTATQSPYAWILCRYPEDSLAPFTAAQVAHVIGPSYPGAEHYFRELSNGQFDLSGSRVYGWYTLPKPRSAYDAINTSQLTIDCVAAADAEIHFPDYEGFAIQVSGPLGRDSSIHTPPAHAGNWFLNADGVIKEYAAVWLSRFAAFNYAMVHHEMGHSSFDWRHSVSRSGLHGASRWDIMSTMGSFDDPTYGLVGPHTISFNKFRSGWIRPSHIWRPDAGAPKSLLLLESAVPPSESGYQAAFIPTITTPRGLYSVEVRRNGRGYDRGLPGQYGVVIHKVDTTAGYWENVPRVVTTADNEDPNGDGGLWLPGETFVDLSDNVYVRVDSFGPGGVWLTMRPPSIDASCAARDLLTAPCLTATAREFLDAAGNADGNYNIGDFLAYLEREGLQLNDGPGTTTARVTTRSTLP